MEIAGFSYRGVHEMTGLVGSSIRRIAGLFGVVAAVALIAAPVALANNDTINVTGDGPVLGRCRQPRPRANATSATIDWGDGTTLAESESVTIAPAPLPSAARTPTPPPPRALNTGTITFTGGNCTQRCHGQLHGERRAPPPEFTECPAVYQRHRLPVPDRGQQRH